MFNVVQNTAQNAVGIPSINCNQAAVSIICHHFAVSAKVASIILLFL